VAGSGPFLSMDVRVIFVAVGLRQVGRGKMDIKAFQGFTHDFQHIRVTLTFLSMSFLLSLPGLSDRNKKTTSRLNLVPRFSTNIV